MYRCTSRLFPKWLRVGIGAIGTGQLFVKDTTFKNSASGIKPLDAPHSTLGLRKRHRFAGGRGLNGNDPTQCRGEQRPGLIAGGSVLN